MDNDLDMKLIEEQDKKIGKNLKLKASSNEEISSVGLKDYWRLVKMFPSTIQTLLFLFFTCAAVVS